MAIAGYDGAMYSSVMSISNMQQAAESGDPQAAFNLAWCYYIGNGVDIDKSEAKKWYDRAATLGVREAVEIRQCLEIESQREQEVRALMEIAVSPGKRPARLFIAAVIIPVLIGAVAVVIHMTGGKPEGETLHAMTRSHGDQEDQPMLDREEVSPRDGASPYRSDYVSDTSQAEHGDTDATLHTAPSVPAEKPTGVQRSSTAPTPLEGLARRWLEDVNDLYNPSAKSKDIDEGYRQD